MNRKEILRKLSGIICQESVNVSMIETLRNLLLKNRAEKVRGEGRGGEGEGERKEDTVRCGCQRRNTSGGAAARSITTMQQFGRKIEWLEQQWRRWWYYLQNLQNPQDRTDGEMWRLGSIWYMRWIYLPKMLWQERYFADDNFS